MSQKNTKNHTNLKEWRKKHPEIIRPSIHSLSVYKNEISYAKKIELESKFLPNASVHQLENGLVIEVLMSGIGSDKVAVFKNIDDWTYYSFVEHKPYLSLVK